MLKTLNVRPMLMALAVAGAVGGAGSAWAGALPPVHTQGQVAYLSGGVGQQEAKSIEAAAARWPVMLEFAVKDTDTKRDAFLTNVSVQIIDKAHSMVLDTKSEGPFVLARLQPGQYTVKATFDGKTMERTLNVAGKGTAREIFVWPHGAEKVNS